MRSNVPAWPDGIDSDVVGCQGESHAARKVVDAAFAGIVGSDCRDGHDAID